MITGKRTDGVRAPLPAKEPSFPRGTVSVSGFLVFAGLAIGVWLYMTATSSPHHEQIGTIIFRSAIPVVLGVIVAFVVAVTGLRSWHATVKRHLTEQKEEHRRTLSSARMQISELQTVAQTIEQVHEDKTQLEHAKA